MVSLLSTSSIYLYNQEVVNLNTLFAQGFAQGFDFQITDHDKIN